MRNASRAFRALPLIALLACSSFLDPEEYDLLPPFADLAFASITPSATFDLWDLRETSPSGTHRVLGGGGALSRSAVPPAILAQFDETQPQAGFDPTCAPGYCYKYFVSLQAGSIDTWNSEEDARAFLGMIDNRVEAAVLAKVHGYHWESTKETAGIREVAGGYEVVALALVKFCAPVQFDRFLLRIGSSGDVRILKREVWRADANACI